MIKIVPQVSTAVYRLLGFEFLNGLQLEPLMQGALLRKRIYNATLGSRKLKEVV